MSIKRFIPHYQFGVQALVAFVYCLFLPVVARMRPLIQVSVSSYLKVARRWMWIFLAPWLADNKLAKKVYKYRKEEFLPEETKFEVISKIWEGYF